MSTVEKLSVVADPALNYIHFQGVDAPPRSLRLGKTLRQTSPVPRIPSQQRMIAGLPEKLDPLAAWVLERAGISPDAYRARPLNRRISALLRQLKVNSPKAARDLLDAKPDLLPAALNTLLIGVSAFFRDATVFDYLRVSVLPHLLRTSRGVSVVAAGVSNGYELYSMAILLAEVGALDHSSLLGIDCRTGAIERARLGCFSGEELATLDDVWRFRYFQEEGTAWRADARLRASIQWRCADLLTFRPPPSDLILFCNVAIYLEDRAAASVWEQLCSALTPNGCLIVGKAEKPPGNLPLHCLCKSVYRKKDTSR